MIISLSLFLPMFVFQTNLSLAINSAPIDFTLTNQDTSSGPIIVQENNSASETPANNDTQEQDERNRISPEQNNNHIFPETPRQPMSSTSENGSALSSTETQNDNSSEGIILNTLPEIPQTTEPDTIAKILAWWSANPFEMKLWYLFLTLSILIFLFRKISFRKPFLFMGLIIFGFYLGNTVNPINSIFSIPVQTGVKLIDSLVLVGIPIVLSLFIGRFFCGWACPIGAIQEFIHPENLNLRLPPLLDRIFSYFRFILLIGGILFSWLTMSNIWNSYDPFQSFFSFKWTLIPAAILFIILIGSVLIERFFCRYLCPLGGLLAVTSRFSLFKMRPDSDVCIACGKCSQPGACSMNMIASDNPYTDLPQMEASECILCHRCANICRYSAVKLSFSFKKKDKPVKAEHSSQNFSA